MKHSYQVGKRELNDIFPKIEENYSGIRHTRSVTSKNEDLMNFLY